MAPTDSILPAPAAPRRPADAARVAVRQHVARRRSAAGVPFDRGQLSMACGGLTPLQRLSAALSIACLGLLGSPSSPQSASAAAPPTETASVAASDDQATDETWDVHFLRDPKAGKRRKSGYRRTAERRVAAAGGTRRRLEADELLHLQRFGHRTEIRLRAWSVETLAGQPLEFGYRITMQPNPQEVTGRIEGDTLHCQLTTGGRRTSAERPWPERCGGLFAVEQSLRDHPMEPGQRRTVECLQPIPILTDLATAPLLVSVRLAAADWEEVDLLSDSAKRLRIESTTILPAAGTIRATLWTNRQGDIVKTQATALGQETFRTTREVALREERGDSFDIGWDGLVTVAHPLPNPHETHRVLYRVTVVDGRPDEVLAACPSQQVKPIGPHTAEVTVRRIRPDAPVQVTAGKVAAADRQPNRMIQSDDARIVAMARTAAAEATDPWTIALALERQVHDTLVTTDFSQVFASAAEVARTGRGDCTEYAVLLAALCRARDIPARVAFGLVYVAARHGFLYHMWTEVWIKDRWIPLDATIGRGGIGADHLKLSDSNLHGASAYTGLLPIADVLGRLQIDVVRAE